VARLGTLPSGCFPAVTAVSNDGSFIIRVPQNLGQAWYENMALLRFSGEPSVQLLASPSTPSPAQSTQSHSDLSIPQCYTVRFSPGSRYVGAYDRNCAFVWSTGSHKWMAQYRVQDFNTWIFNTGLEPPCLYNIPVPVSCNPTLLLIPDSGATRASSTKRELGHDMDESWLKRPFYDLSPSIQTSQDRIKVYSSAMGRIPLVDGDGRIWFNGEDELKIPYDYAPTVRSGNSFSEKEAWYGDLMLKGGGRRDPDSIYFPRASKDGTRFLLQGKLKAPVVVDISQVV
ncbi:uncharacterized protein EI90DRAFT_3085719, partial [Cantharellus anzutake]|uniref:uncharacterized protein n=1 Tax=Cantharellus anzutake TaxID=1750568 RepID=UPI0019038362